MTNGKTQKTKTKMAVFALPFFDFSTLSRLFEGSQNTDYILAILLVFLAFFSLWFVLIFFQKIHKASPRFFYFLSLTLILGGLAYGADRIIEREMDFEEVGIQIPKKIGSPFVKGENDFAGEEEGISGEGESEGISLEEILTSSGIWWNEKGDPHGALQVRNNRIKLKTGRVTSRAIKDETIRDEDIDDDIKLHVQDLFVSRNVEIDGTATFQNGATISGGNLIVSGNVAAGTVNGNTITTGTGTLTLDSYTLVLSGNSNINQNLLTTSSPTFAGLTLNGNLVLGANTLTTTNVGLVSNLNADMTDGYHLDQNVLTTSSPTFNGLTLAGNTILNGTNPILDLTTASTLNINTTNNRPVTFGTGLVTIPNLAISDSGVDYGTMTIDSDATTENILTVTGAYLTSGTGILKNITANAGNGQITTGEKVVLTDATIDGGGYTGISVAVSGSGIGSGNKYLLDLNPGTNMQVVFDSSGAFRPTTSVASNTNTIGSPSYYWKNGYFDQITANNLSGTVVTGATSSTTWTIGSTQTGDVNEALIFQRNSGSGNATLEWRRGTNDLRYLSANYPFNSTYTVDDSSIGTGINLFSGNLTNNTTSGTQRLMSLTNTGTGTTETGIYLGNTGTATTAIEIAGTWTNGIVTNNNSINTGTGTITGASYNGLGLTSNADGFSITGGVIPRTLSVTGEEITLIATSPTSITLPITGTIATLAGAETFTNKVSYNGLVITANTGVITTGTWNGTSLADAYVDNNITLAGGTISGTSNTMSLGSDATGDIYYRDSSGYLARLAIGASGTVLQGGTTPAWSTATYPSTATGTGTFLRANGTNWVASTSTLADTFGINTLLYASSANTVTGLATGNSSVLLTDGSGVPSWSSIATDIFTQYILASGTRAFTGSQSLGDFNITNVGDISLDSISSDAETSINVVLGSDAGDDFTVDTDKLVVEGDTGNVGIGATAPTAKLYVDQTAAANLVDLRDGGVSIFQIADGGLISMHGSITYNSAAKPKRSLVLTSSGATIPTSGGATQTKVDGTNHTYYVLDFGDATDSSSFWQWTMPDSYDGGTIDVTFYWEAAATTGDVVWAAQTAGVDPDNTEDIDPTLGSAQTVTDTAQGNANDLASATISSWSPSWAAGDYIVFKTYRDADAGGDTMSGNARLVKVKVEYSVSAESD